MERREKEEGKGTQRRACTCCLFSLMKEREGEEGKGTQRRACTTCCCLSRSLEKTYKQQRERGREVVPSMCVCTSKI